MSPKIILDVRASTLLVMLGTESDNTNDDLINSLSTLSAKNRLGMRQADLDFSLSHVGCMLMTVTLC